MKEKMTITLAVASMAVLSAALLAGCGKPGSSPEGGNKGGNKLDIYNWGEYIDESVITQLEDGTGVQVVYDVLKTNEEMYLIIETSAMKYDVVCPSDYMIQHMIENSLLVELNFDNIPDYKKISQQHLDISKGLDPRDKYSIPYCWGIMGILYSTRRLEELDVLAPTKWSGLWDECLSGETLVQNNVGDAFTVTLKTEGYSLDSTNPDELAQARDLLTEQKPLAQTYMIDQVGDKMIGGETAVGVICSGEMLYIQDAVTEQGLDYNLEYVIPEGGTSYWIDFQVIPANVKHKENAEKRIDFLCRPDIAKKNLEYITYATPNTGAYDLLDDDLKNNKALSLDLDKLPNCETIQYLGDDVDIVYNDMWKEIKFE